MPFASRLFGALWSIPHIISFKKIRRETWRMLCNSIKTRDSMTMAKCHVSTYPRDSFSSSGVKFPHNKYVPMFWHMPFPSTDKYLRFWHVPFLLKADTWLGGFCDDNPLPVLQLLSHQCIFMKNPEQIAPDGGWVFMFIIVRYSYLSDHRFT